MLELKALIRTYMEAIAPPIQYRTEGPAPWWRLRPFAAVIVGASIVAIPTLVLWGILGRTSAPEPPVPPATVVTTVPSTTRAPETTTTTVPPTTTTTTKAPPTPTQVETAVIGTWVTVPDAPVAQAPTVSVWTGSELIVWGDETGAQDRTAAGMAYDPVTGTWRELATAPESRSQPAGVWTGSQLLIWGGATSEGVTNDGFAYDPETDHWTDIPPAPLDPQTFPFHVWTGDELIVWGGSAEIEHFLLRGTTEGAAYDPTSETWRLLARAPLGVRNPGVAIWTGEAMIIGGNGDHTDGDTSWAAYDPVADSWTELPDPPVRAGGVSDGVWTGTEVIFSTTQHNLSGNRRWSEAYAYNPTTNTWRQTASPDQLLQGAGHAWTGEYLVYWGRTGFPFTMIRTMYDPLEDTWHGLAPSPLSNRFGYGTVTALDSTTVIVWGGINPTTMTYSDGAILILDND